MRKLHRRYLAVAVNTMPIAAGCFRQASAADDKCWPIGNLIFPAGSRDDVIRKAAVFLVKAEAIPPHPYWPGGTSGVTLGVGWDAGYHSRAELRETWAALGVDALALLDSAAGKKGHEAQALIPRLRAIDIPRTLSIQVLNNSLNDDYYPLVVQLFGTIAGRGPGCFHLRRLQSRSVDGARSRLVDRKRSRPAF